MNTKKSEIDETLANLVNELDGTRHLGRGVLHASGVAINKVAHTLTEARLARFPRFISIYLPVLGHTEIAIVSVNLKDISGLKEFTGTKCVVNNEQIKIGNPIEMFELPLKNKGEGIGFVFVAQVAVFESAPTRTDQDFFDLTTDNEFLLNQLKFPKVEGGESAVFHHQMQTIESDLPSSGASPVSETGKAIKEVLRNLLI